MNDFRPNPMYRKIGIRLLFLILVLFAAAILAPILGALILGLAALLWAPRG